MKLTSLSHGAGCACKIGAAQLAGIRDALPPTDDPQLLIGLDPADDAAVYQLSEHLAIVQTIDFFTPIVDDPFDFGRIAAANALSDIYAMGATPKVALNVLAFPLDLLGEAVLTRILQGGAAAASQAGVAVAGGHSIDDPEPKYGMAVTGTVDPADVVTKAGAMPGDVLFLTKPVGGGLITTASKRGLAGTESIAAAVDVMTRLNAQAAKQARAAGVHAMTDVTGFGLLGHLHELCFASGVAAEIDAASVPILPGAQALASDPQCWAGGSQHNSKHAEGFANWSARIPHTRRVLLTDAMTSGGLLVAVPEEYQLNAPGTYIGRILQGAAGTVHVR